MAKVDILVGDCRKKLEELEPKSIQTCITSPPYFRLRDYGHAGQIGLEKTLDEYVDQLVQVFRGVHRALRDDGTVWLVIGDCYATDVTSKRTTGSNGVGGWTSPANQIERRGLGGGDLKTKDLIGVPWAVAFALRRDGWYLRSEIIWAKPNPMPESVEDRPTKSHEQIFLLSKSERYFYDAEAIKELADPSEGRPHGIVRDRLWGYDSKESILRRNRPSVKRKGFNGKTNELAGREAFRALSYTKNKRDVWEIKAEPYREAHFATYPPDLILPCVLAGTSPKACEHCGAPFRRILGEKIPTDGRASGNLERKHRTEAGGPIETEGRNQCYGIPWQPFDRPTLGWEKTCECESCTGSARCRVLDPFGGAGTTGLVADRTDRDAVLIELNPEYVEMIRRRLTKETPLFSTLETTMPDEFARVPRRDRPNHTAPVLHPALLPHVEGEGLNDVETEIGKPEEPQPATVNRPEPKRDN